MKKEGTAEAALEKLQRLYSAFKFIEQRLTQKKAKLKVKLPEIEKTHSSLVQMEEQAKLGEALTTHYELAQSVFAKAKINVHENDKVRLPRLGSTATSLSLVFSPSFARSRTLPLCACACAGASFALPPIQSRPGRSSASRLSHPSSSTCGSPRCACGLALMSCSRIPVLRRSSFLGSSCGTRRRRGRQSSTTWASCATRSLRLRSTWRAYSTGTSRNGGRPRRLLRSAE
jgi:hypothetical protein